MGFLVLLGDEQIKIFIIFENNDYNDFGIMVIIIKFYGLFFINDWEFVVMFYNSNDILGRIVFL